MDKVDMERLWEETLSLFLRQATVDSPNKEHFIRSLLYSLDHNPHLIGIDGSDVINFFKGSDNLRILYEEFSDRGRMISLEELQQSFPAYSPLYVHCEFNHSLDENGPVIFLAEMECILNIWVTQDSSREILFSFVYSPSPDRLLKLWQVFPS